jgi:predicted kinase
MSTLYVMVGVPGSGKSTWIQRQDLTSAVVLSTDDYIEHRARALGKTYSDVFESEIKAAEQHLRLELVQAIKLNQVIYWDQTNISVNSRAKKLGAVPAHYRRIAVYFPTPLEVVQQRLLDRAQATGKLIPASVMRRMTQQLTLPTISEGFDEIWSIT